MSFSSLAKKGREEIYALSEKPSEPVVEAPKVATTQALSKSADVKEEKKPAPAPPAPATPAVATPSSTVL